MADHYIILPYLQGYAVYRCDQHGGARITDALPRSSAYARRAKMVAGPVTPVPNHPATPSPAPVIAQAEADPPPERHGRRDHAKPKVVTRMRPCMTCGTTFESQGAHNRMCNFCRRLGEDVQANPYSTGTASGLRRRA